MLAPSLFASIFLIGQLVLATEAATSKLESYEQPLCGLLAALAGVESAGIAPKVSLNELCEQGLVGELGSTTQQLERAISMLGGTTQVISNCTLNELTLLQRPAILHVASGGVNTPVDHWILFLGVDSNGRALIAEPPSQSLPLSVMDLNAIWDGLAIVITDKEATMANIIPVTAKSLRLLFLALPLCAGFLCYLIFHRFVAGARNNLVLTIPCILAGAFTICVIRNAISADSLFSPQSVRKIQSLATTKSDFVIPVIDVSTFSKRTPSDGEVIVDTRLARDFRLGAIKGAINIPVNVTHTEFMNRCRTLNKHSTMYLYCQSSKCTYSDTVALRMARYGFENIVVIRDGYIALEKLRGEGANIR